MNSLIRKLFLGSFFFVLLAHSQMFESPSSSSQSTNTTTPVPPAEAKIKNNSQPAESSLTEIPKSEADRLKYWNSLPIEKKRELLKTLDQFNSESSDQQDALKKRLAQFNQMSSSQRALAMKHWKDFQQLPADKQAEIKKRVQEFNELSPEEKAKQRREFKKMKQQFSKQDAEQNSAAHRKPAASPGLDYAYPPKVAPVDSQFSDPMSPAPPSGEGLQPTNGSRD